MELYVVEFPLLHPSTPLGLADVEFGAAIPLTRHRLRRLNWNYDYSVSVVFVFSTPSDLGERQTRIRGWVFLAEKWDHCCVDDDVSFHGGCAPAVTAAKWSDVGGLL